MIPYGRQDVTETDIRAVCEVLRSDWLTQGPGVPAFESAVAKRVGVAHAVGVNSATSALHIACLALGLGPGGRLWTVPNTFVASANCARYCGAAVDFVDIDSDTWNMSLSALEKKLRLAQSSDALPDIVVPVHFSGQSTDARAIFELSREFGFRIVEDASHAIGAAHRGELVGSCRWSHVTVFSFHPVKIITSAEGGMCLTNDAEVAARLAMLRTHGITRDPARLQQPDAPAWHYEQHMLGFNYRMTDLHAVLGTSQLTRVDDYVQRRNELALRYDRLLAHLPVQRPYVAPENRSAFHLYVVRVKATPDRKDRRQVFEAMRARRIGVNVHYAPVHLHPYYRALGFGPGMFPEAEAHGDEAITLPLFPTMSEQDQDFVASTLEVCL